MNQKARAIYFPEEYEVFPVVSEKTIPDEQIKPNTHKEIDGILNRLMLILPHFSGINYETWANNMEDLLCSTNLLH